MWIVLLILAFIIFMGVYSFKNFKKMNAKHKELKQKVLDNEMQAAIERREKHLHQMRTNPMYAMEYERQGQAGRSSLEIFQIAKDDTLIEKAVREGKIPPMQ